MDDNEAQAAAARECAAIAADLERLKTLIGEAGETLVATFGQLAATLPNMAASDAQRQTVARALNRAVSSLQFQDMATQLTEHAQRRLTVLENCVRTMTHGEIDPLLASTRMQPVRQNGMGIGSIDLF